MNNTIPELSDDQIESMRFAIMNDVDKTTRAKTRLYRKVVIGTCAVVAFAGVGTTVVRSIDALNLTAGTSSDRSDSNATSSDDGAARDLGGTDTDKAAPESTAGDSGFAAPNAVAPEDSAREIVTTGSIGMTVSKPVDTARRISTYVSTVGGRVDSRSETAAKDDDGGQVRLVIRVPQTKVEDSVATFRTYGTVDYVNIEDYDATAEGKDLDARISALKVSSDRLSDLMARADSTNELIRAESALTQRQAELDSLVSQRKSLSDRVALSSLEIELAAKPAASSPSTSGFWGGVVDGWNGLVSTFEGALHGFGVILPWLLALSVLGAVGWLITRRRTA